MAMMLNLALLALFLTLAQAPVKSVAPLSMLPAPRFRRHRCLRRRRQRAAALDCRRRHLQRSRRRQACCVSARRVRRCHTGSRPASTASIRIVLQPATFADSVVVTADRGAYAASERSQRNRDHVRGVGQQRRRRARRCAAADAGLFALPPGVITNRESDNARRDAARRVGIGREPHDGAGRRRAAQRSVRQLGLLEPGAAWRRSIASKSCAVAPAISTAPTRSAASFNC